LRKLLILVAVVAILVTSIVISLIHREAIVNSSSELENFLPTTLIDRYEVVEIVTGEDAIKMTKSIHWNPGNIAPLDAIVAIYSDGTRVWISKIDSACKVVEIMASKMQKYENMLPYTVPVQHNIGGKNIYLSLDKRSGKLHAFWCINEKVLIWVETGSSGIDGLREFIK